MNKASKKFRRRRTSSKGAGDMPAAVVVHLTEMSDNICGLSGYDSTLLAAQTSKILSLISTENHERKALMHKTSSGLSIILKTLKVADSCSVVSDILSLLLVLVDHNFTTQLVKRSVVSAVMVSLSDTYRSAWNSDSILTLHLTLLNKLSTSDKRFSVKARLSGIVTIVVAIMKKYQDNHDILVIVLRLLQALASNSVTADSIGKLGCLSTLGRFLSKKDMVVVKHCINVLGLLLKIKSNANRPAAQTCVKQLVFLHDQLHRTDINCRHILLRKKILNCIKTCITREVNLQAFHKCNGLEILYNTAVQSSEGSRKASRGISSLTCIVLRRCLPLLPLPLSSLENPTRFQLPLDQVATLLTDTSASSSTKTTTSDLSAQVAPEEHEGTEGSPSLDISSTAVYQSDSDSCSSDKNCNNDNSTGQTRGPACYMAQVDIEDLSKGMSSLMNSKVDLEHFRKYFPELSESEEKLTTSVHFLPLASASSSSQACNPWQEEKESDSETKVTVVVPTAVPSSEVSSKPPLEAVHLFKAATKFVEKPAPQLLGHLCPDKLEAMYSKGVSVDRKLYLSDIARITNPTSLLNRTVFDLDELVEPCSPESKETLTLEDEEMAIEKSASHPRALVDSMLENCQQPQHSDPGLTELQTTLPTINSGPLLSSRSDTSSNQQAPCDHDLEAILGLGRRCSLCSSVMDETPTTLEMPTPTPPCMELKEEPEVKASPMDQNSSKQGLQTGPILEEMRDSEQQSCNSWCNTELLKLCLSSGQHESLLVLDDESRVASQQSLDEDLEWDTSENNLVGSVTEDASIPHLEFESRFESGNLRKAIQVRQYEYDLLLNADINTSHHHQWFYFKVSNNKAGVTYRFNIVNCEKVNSQFNYGMQPLMFSSTAHRLNQQGWVRAGTKISYYSNNYTIGLDKGPNERVLPSKKRKVYYTMTFSIVFQHEQDTCYFAYHYPYTYSMLLRDLGTIEEDIKDRDMFYHRQSLCTTLCGNACPLITISNQPRHDASSEVEVEEKKYVVISARVHPGESNSSWIMQGLLHHLTSNHPNALMLRDKFVFKIIPMLNPDGVIHGSHRCSLSGEDLNRQWKMPNPIMHPTIYSIKALLQWLVTTTRRPEVFCDFHGHSRRKNIFMYGCKDPSGSCIEQVLPRHLDKIAPLFSYGCCSFVVEKSKEATARVVVWRELGVARSYTMESTYCGADQGQQKGKQIDTAALEEMGTLFCVGLQHLEEQVGYTDDDSKDSIEYITCHSDSSCNLCESSVEEDDSLSGDSNDEL